MKTLSSTRDINMEFKQATTTTYAADNQRERYQTYQAVQYTS